MELGQSPMETLEMIAFNEVFKNKKIFITGHTGFKGSWLTFWLRRMGAEICGYSDAIPTQPSHFELLNFQGIRDIRADINNYKALEKEILSFAPDLIFHLAAQPLVRYSYAHPIETFMTNVMGTAHILDIARHVKNLKGLIVITSDKCYENFEDNRAYREDDRYGGHDPYSASKGAAEIVIQSYRKSFYSPSLSSVLLASVRAGNVIGGGDWSEDRLIPDLIRSALSKQSILIRRPDSERPWQHVLEPLSGYLMLGQWMLEGNLPASDNWNFGPLNDASMTVKKVAELSKKIWNEISFEFPQAPDPLHEAKFLRLDSSKARNVLRWEPVWSMEQSIEKTILWYKAYYRENYISTQDQLNEYLSDAYLKGLSWIKNDAIH